MYNMFKKRFFHIFLIAILGTGIIALGEFLYGNDTPVWLDTIIIFCIFLISFIATFLNDEKNWSLLHLVDISNNIPKGETKTTSVVDFLEQSEEEDLKKGDIVKILTNDLSNYDLLPHTLNIIADNINEGVIYEYYLPLSNESQLWEQVYVLVTSILKKTNSVKLMNLKIFDINKIVIYSFAIVQQNSLKKAYWYLSTEKDLKNSNLLIVELVGSEKVKLEQVFAKMKGEYISFEKILFKKEI